MTQSQSLIFLKFWYEKEQTQRNILTQILISSSAPSIYSISFSLARSRLVILWNAFSSACFECLDEEKRENKKLTSASQARCYLENKRNQHTWLSLFKRMYTRNITRSNFNIISSLSLFFSADVLFLDEGHLNNTLFIYIRTL